MKKPVNSYPLHQCGLYGLKTRGQLAKRLNRSLPYLQSRANRSEFYKTWNEPKKSGGFRVIEAPRPDLKIIQKRIAELLQRVTAPDFLYSPVRGRSYIDNALIHRESESVHLLDVTDYFGHCLARSVYDFFHRQLRCAPDVAHLLTGLTTKNGHLPQGSPASPILSFYCSLDMWTKIAERAAESGCIMSLYVDDITISGKTVPKSLVFEIKGILNSSGHQISKTKERSRHLRPAEVTGVVVGKGKATVPHRHYKKLMQARNEARTGDTDDDRQRAKSRATSLEYQVAAVSRR